MSERQTARTRPELLAPAGGPEALHAAIAAGADAVYVGLKTLNARRGAPNLSLREFEEAARYAHVRGRRVYLTANIVITAEEAGSALETVEAAWCAGADAVIVQDLGLMRLLRRDLPDVRLHASTQIDAHNAPSVAALAELGVQRVTLARETSLAEVGSMVANASVELESFVHGSLCVSYSGQCLMSSAIGGRSANRGLCAQPCRMAYRLVDGRGDQAVCPGSYLLSPRDLAGITVLPGLIEAGVTALKIEGRMKSAEYVALVVGVYRGALDRAWNDPEGFAVAPGEWATLQEAFSRGFTEGSLTGRFGEERMSYQRPNNRGVAVGRIASSQGTRATVLLERALDAADTVEVWTRRGRFAQRTGDLEVGGRVMVHAPAGARATFTLEQPASAGDRVFRVANASLLDAARRLWTEERPSVPLSLDVRLRVGDPVSLTVSAGGVSASAEGPVVEAARTKRVTAPEVMEHIGRLGGTPYVADEWKLDLDPAAGIGFSALHHVRRAAIAALDTRRLAEWSMRRPARPALAPARDHRSARGTALPALVVAVDTPEAASACLAAGAERALVLLDAVGAPALPAGAVPLLPRVAHEAETHALLEQVTGGAAATGNLGLVRELAARGVAVEADWGLNVLNPWAAEALAGVGATSIWASPELSGRQLAELARGSVLPVGALVFGRLELMVTEQCVLAAAGACGRDCARCGRRQGGWTLRDRKGYAFPVGSDACGRSHVYNAVTLDLSRSVGELLDAGLAAVRLELHGESDGAAASATAAWRRVLDEAGAGAPARERPVVEPATTGHFYRGLR